MTKRKKVFVAAMLLLLIIIVLVIIVYFLPMAYLMFHSDQILKKQLDNGYVNGEFAGWNQVEVRDIGRFWLPMNWNLLQENDCVTILDDKDEQIAVGFVYLSDNGVWSNMTYQSLSISMAEHAGFVPSSVEHSPVTEYLSFDGCELNHVVFRDENNEAAYYCLKLRNAQHHELHLLFPDRGNLNESDVLSLTQAIAYSFVYRK